MGLFNKFFGNKDKDFKQVKLSLIDYNIYFDNTNIDNTPLEFLDLGELNLTTGEIVACDPLVCLHDTVPFTTTVNPGKYLPNKPGLNVIIFHSGYGDSMYPHYCGTNDEGKICSLIVNFQVF
jgi:hypothetical protein